MTLEQIQHLLEHGEGLHVEFKQAREHLPRTLFETICAFLNRDGGTIVLGVDDSGIIEGIDPAYREALQSDIVTLSNNQEKLDPPFILFPVAAEIQGKTILLLQVPKSSQVHRTKGLVFDRSHESDFVVKTPGQIADLFNQKRNFYSEGIAYPYLRFDDFKHDLFDKVRHLIRSKTPAHPWLGLSDREMLHKAGLVKKDYSTGEEGYTLAAALLFGTDEVIQNILPHYKIDALLRRENLDRYDDRVDIRTNLIEAYEKLMQFVANYLPDTFFMEGDLRISLREKIFREIAANLLVHREYTNAYPATFIIYQDRLEVKNANNPHGHGPLRLYDFTPFPKNPMISKFFLQLGRVEEIGSGIINVCNYLKYYVPGAIPQFIEGHPFQTIIPLISEKHGKYQDKAQDEAQDEVQVSLNATDQKILRFMQVGTWSTSELRQNLGYSTLTGNLKLSFKKLKEWGLIAYTIPEKPRSRNQRYLLTPKGKEVLTQNEASAL